MGWIHHRKTMAMAKRAMVAKVMGRVPGVVQAQAVATVVAVTVLALVVLVPAVPREVGT